MTSKLFRIEGRNTSKFRGVAINIVLSLSLNKGNADNVAVNAMAISVYKLGRNASHNLIMRCNWALQLLNTFHDDKSERNVATTCRVCCRKSLFNHRMSRLQLERNTFLVKLWKECQNGRNL